MYACMYLCMYIYCIAYECECVIYFNVLCIMLRVVYTVMNTLVEFSKKFSQSQIKCELSNPQSEAK